MRCILCNLDFPEGKIPCIGNMGCYIHPLNVNRVVNGKTYKKGHYECCGLSDDPNDKDHYEVKSIKGCHKIDHVFTSKDLEYIKNHTVRLYPLSMYSDDDMKLLNINESIVAIIRDRSEVKNINYKHFFNPFKREIKQTLLSEYDDLIDALSNQSDDPEFDAVSSSLYKLKDVPMKSSTYYIYEREGSSKSAGQIALVRQVATTIDETTTAGYESFGTFCKNITGN